MEQIERETFVVEGRVSLSLEDANIVDVAIGEPEGELPTPIVGKLLAMEMNNPGGKLPGRWRMTMERIRES